MQSDIYQHYEASGEEGTKMKLKDLTYQVLKNAVSMVEVAMGAHQILNSQENVEFKQRNAIEQHLIGLRNDFLTHTISSNTVIMNSINNFRNVVVANEDSSHIGRQLNNITNNIQNEWNKNSVNPTKLRDKLTDLLRIVDPES